MAERVLVLPRALVPGGCEFHGVRPARRGALADLRAAVIRHGTFLDREVAELDPAHKQLIPYVVVRDGEAIFLTHRTDAGGDARLHGRASIGIGGHLNPVDDGTDALMAGLRREWLEEMDVGWMPEFDFVGLLNDDTNPVGAVHLGVVFSVESRGRAVAVREHDKLVGEYVAVDRLAEWWDRLETWSQLVAAEIGVPPPLTDEPAVSRRGGRPRQRTS